MLIQPIPPTPERIAEAVLAAQARQKQGPFEYDIFLTYATADEKRAEQIRDALEAKGLSCFMSSKELSGGDNFSEVIRDALTTSREVCLLFSPNSAKSEWVLTEWGAAWAFKKRIVPILYRIDVVSLPERLKTLQVIDFSDIEQYVSQAVCRSRKEE